MPSIVLDTQLMEILFGFKKTTSLNNIIYTIDNIWLGYVNELMIHFYVIHRNKGLNSNAARTWIGSQVKLEYVGFVNKLVGL